MIEILYKLQDSNFVLYELFFLTVLIIWGWMLFFNGAPKWSKFIEGYYKTIGAQSLGKLFPPFILKIYISIILLGTIAFGIRSISDRINNF